MSADTQVPELALSYSFLMSSIISKSEQANYDENTKEFQGNLQYCQFQKNKGECLMNYGLSDCNSLLSKLSNCFMMHGNNKALCIPEDEKLRNCFQRKTSDLVMSSYNLM